jgi:hypothetical protein
METAVIEKTFNTKTLAGNDLIELMAMKEEFPYEAEQAFTEFCFRYESDILKKSEIFCSKWGYSEVEALQIAHCAFSRVWKYPTFQMCKAKSRNVDKAIKLWLYPIVYTQLLLTLRKNTCVEPTEEEDLSLITNVEELISATLDEDDQPDGVSDKLAILNAAMAGLSEKHRIIYLTYKAYRPKGNNIPRSVSKKLWEQLDLTQNTIGVYKMQAEQHINQHLAQYHENK